METLHQTLPLVPGRILPPILTCRPIGKGFVCHPGGGLFKERRDRLVCVCVWALFDPSPYPRSVSSLWSPWELPPLTCDLHRTWSVSSPLPPYFDRVLMNHGGDHTLRLRGWEDSQARCPVERHTHIRGDKCVSSTVCVCLLIRCPGKTMGERFQ